MQNSRNPFPPRPFEKPIQATADVQSAGDSYHTSTNTNNVSTDVTMRTVSNKQILNYTDEKNFQTTASREENG